MADYVFLGRGTFNIAILDVKNNNVLRIHAQRTKDLMNDDARDIEEGYELNKMFASDVEIYGPCAPEVMGLLKTNDMREFPGLREFIAKDIAKDYFKVPREYTIIQMEQLHDYRVPFDHETWVNDAFFLIWFFFTTQYRHFFMHKDFKFQNLALQFLPKEVMFEFHLLGKIYYVRTNRIPKVIDYDFGIVHTLRDTEKRLRGGTITSMPPEVILKVLIRQPSHGINEIIGQDHIDLALDWWSLGCVLLGCTTTMEKGTMFIDFGRPAGEYIAHVSSQLIGNDDNNSEHLKVFFNQLFILIRLLDHPIPEYMRFIYPEFFFEDLDFYFDQVMKTSHWSKKIFKAWNAAPEEQKEIIRNLLQWTPEMRSFVGYTHRHLTQPIAFQRLTIEPDVHDDQVIKVYADPEMDEKTNILRDNYQIWSVDSSF
jgi:serine/threonine protein kinase